MDRPINDYSEFWDFFPAFFVVGYGFAWFAHFVIEKNKPASFRFPLWSFISDFKMIWFMISGRMAAEVKRVLDNGAIIDDRNS